MIRNKFTVKHIRAATVLSGAVFLMGFRSQAEIADSNAFHLMWVVIFFGLGSTLFLIGSVHARHRCETLIIGAVMAGAAIFFWSLSSEQSLQAKRYACEELKKADRPASCAAVLTEWKDEQARQAAAMEQKSKETLQKIAR